MTAVILSIFQIYPHIFRGFPGFMMTMTESDFQNSYRMPFLFLPDAGMRPRLGPPQKNVKADFRWGIIGGGIHGTYLANALKNGAGVPLSRIAVFDPADELLHFWNKATSHTGMTHLRSSSVHHLDYFPVSLRRYYSRRAKEFPEPYVPKYNRPSLALFNSHARWIINRESINGLHIQTRIEGLERTDGGWILRSHEDQWTVSNVILALGLGEQPVIPRWAAPLVLKGDAYHLFGGEFPDDFSVFRGKRVCIIGAGISAMQTGLTLMEQGGAASCVLLADHPLSEHDFDSDPGYIGPRRLSEFSMIADPGERRETIRSVRLPGSGDPALVRRVRSGIGEGLLTFIRGRVLEAGTGNGRVNIGYELSAMSGQRRSLEADTVILATGFSGERPGGDLVSALIDDCRLPVSSCGYPVPDITLCWAPGLYVTGPLGELELGPAARNIAGAKRAGERIAAAVRGLL